MRTQDQMWENFGSDLSDELAQMVDRSQFDRWVNDGISRLGFYTGASADLAWVSGDWSVEFPADYCDFDSLEPLSGSAVPAHRIWRRTLRFERRATSPGSATLFYTRLPDLITSTAASTLPDVLDQALVSYALYRFFKWLATSRADFRRYSTIAQGNAADVPQLLAAAAGHRQDFAEAVDVHILQSPVAFFGDT
jgi:hypothetical protein